ncbi:MAG: tRNA (adenosine(37)-N6)-threonylcarbamoyltransferase complex dimerization subunit type 1 TsaB [Acidobacteriota bacterium]
MQILAIDTASPFPSVTLLAPGGVREEALPDDRRASEELLPAVARCLAAAATTLSACDRIAVCAGPGSFTGLRVGLATAWALGRASGVPVEIVPTLEALAETLRPTGETRVAAALDAGRGEVVLCVFDLGGARARPEGPTVRLPLDRARAEAAGLPMAALPPGLFAGAVRPETSPSRALALAVSRAPGPEPPSRLAGIYSRPSAAEEKHGAP